MKFLEHKTKGFFYTILVGIVVFFEMTTLSGFRFVLPGSGKDKGLGLSVEKVSSLKLVGKNVGWQFVVVSIVIIVAILFFAWLFGYNRNPGGLAALVLLQVVPFIGLISDKIFNFFFGFLTSTLLPTMCIFGLQPADKRVGQIIFMIVVIALTVVAWLVGKRVRASYAAKYEFDEYN
ncbi:MAG: hypothetical protein J6P71_02205 [Oscillospiraceae bacterium]|nr:hypothetical protein [Oscillospiraceae bacterium]